MNLNSSYCFIWCLFVLLDYLHGECVHLYCTVIVTSKQFQYQYQFDSLRLVHHSLNTTATVTSLSKFLEEGWASFSVSGAITCEKVVRPVIRKLSARSAFQRRSNRYFARYSTQAATDVFGSASNIHYCIEV